MELTLSVSCGGGEHEVLVEATERGQVRVLFNPCDLLPAAARRLSGSTCAAALAGRLRAFERCLQYTWCQDAVLDRNPDLRDADVDAVIALGPALVMRGGGGTDMVAGIESALRLTPAPDVVVVLTDGWTPYPPRRYTTPVVFGILDPSGYGYMPGPPMPPWKPEDVVHICGP